MTRKTCSSTSASRCAVSHPAIIGPDERLIGSPLATFPLGVAESDEFVWTSGFPYNCVGTVIVRRETRPRIVQAMQYRRREDHFANRPLREPARLRNCSWLACSDVFVSAVGSLTNGCSIASVADRAANAVDPRGVLLAVNGASCGRARTA